MKTRCEKVEREKSDILLRRLASFDTTSTKTAASEVKKNKNIHHKNFFSTIVMKFFSGFKTTAKIKRTFKSIRRFKRRQ